MRKAMITQVVKGQEIERAYIVVSDWLWIINWNKTIIWLRDAAKDELEKNRKGKKKKKIENWQTTFASEQKAFTSRWKTQFRILHLKVNYAHYPQSFNSRFYLLLVTFISMTPEFLKVFCYIQISKLPATANDPYIDFHVG